MDKKEIVPSNTKPAETQARVLGKMKEKTRRAVSKQNKILERLKVEYVDVDFFKPNPYNPNRQSERDFALLCKSMEEDGFTQPVLVLTNGTIIDGEHRWRAARKLGFEKIPTVFTEMSAEQMRISTLRHNRARGSEDVELTAMLLRDLEKLGAKEYAKEELGITETEMEFLLEDTSATDALAGEEYTRAWEPVKATELAEEIDQRMASGEAFQAPTSRGVPLIKSFSPKAAKSILEMDEKLSTAKSFDEAQSIRREYHVHRVSVSFTGKEGQIVKVVLGKKSSEKLYAMCKVRFDQMVADGLIDAETGKPIKEKVNEQSTKAS